MVQKFRLENEEDPKAILLEPAIQSEPDFDLFAKYIKYVPRLAKLKIPKSPPSETILSKRKLKKPKKKKKKVKPQNEVTATTKRIAVLTEQISKSKMEVDNPFTPNDLEALCYALIDEIATEI